MKKITLLIIVSIIINNVINAQCGFLNKQENANTYYPKVVTQSVGIGNAAFLRFAVKNGGTKYHWDVCGFTEYDTQLSGYNGSSGLWYNDDYCAGVSGLNRSSSTSAFGDWTSTYSGTHNVQINRYNCQNWGSGYGSATLYYRCIAPTSPSIGTAGSGTWNVYCYDAGDSGGGSGAWSSEYSGYYTDANINFNTGTYWTNTPYDASTYKGCYIGNDNHSWRAIRTGWSCAVYRIDIVRHDDRGQLYVNGTLAWDHNGCCDAHTGVWTGVLSSTDVVEFRVSEGGGGSNGQLTMNVVTTALNGGTIGYSGATTVCNGYNPPAFTNSASASGGASSAITNGSSTYQWQLNGANIGGATGLTYDPGVLAPGTYNYRRRVIDKCGTIAYSNTRTITVVADPTISITGGSSPVCSGGTFGTLSSSVSGGTGTQTYQWQRNINGAGWTNVGTASTYNTGTVTTTGTYQYRCQRIASGGGCDDPYSNTLTFTVVADPTISISGGTSPICSGGTFGTLNSTVSGGTGTTSYQWQQNVNSAGWTNVGTAATYNTGALTTVGTYQYRCLITQASGCAATSNTLSFTVVADPTISISGGTSPICSGGTFGTLSSSVSGGTGTTSYQWQRNINSAGWTNVGTSSSYGTGTLTTTGTYQYRCLITQASGCAATSNTLSFTVLVDPTAPTLNVASPASSSSVCLTDLVSATFNSGSGGTGCADEYRYTSDGGSSWSSYIPGANILANTVGSNTIQIQSRRICSGNGCDGSAETFATVAQWSVTPNAAVSSVSGTSPLCIGQTATYTASGVVLGGGTGAWSSSNTSVATVNSSTGLVTAIGAGTATITYTITGGCNGTPSASQSVTVTPNSAVGGVSGTSPLCIGQSAVYTASGVVLGGGTGAWSSSNTGVATVDASGNVTAVAAGTANIIYTVTGGCNGPASAQQSVTVNPDASITSVSGTSPLCIGQSAAYTASGVVLGGGTGAWSSSNTGVATVDASGNVTAVAAGTATITYTITGGCNGTPSASQSVTVTPNSAVGGISGTSPLCIGQSAAYTASGVVLGGGTGAWSSSNTGVATVDASGNVTAVAAGTANIIYTVTGGCNGPASAQQSVTVTPNSAVGGVSGTSPLCIGQSAVYTASGVVLGGGTGAWSSSNTGVATVDASGNVTAVAAGTANIIYTVTGGCNGPASAQQSVTVNPDASITSVSGTSPLCIGQSAAYTASGVVLGGGTGAWSSSNTGVATVDASGNVTAVAAGTATITYTITGGCNGTPSASQSVTVTPNSAVGGVSGTSPLCIGQSAAYTASGVVLGGGTGAWSSSNTGVATVDASGNVTAVAAGTANIIYTVTGGCNGPASAQQSVIVNPSAAITSVNGASPICAGNNTSYSTLGVVLGGGIGSWSSSNTGVATVDASGNVTGVSAGTANIIYTITGGCGGTVSAQQTISIDAAPTTAAAGNDQFSCLSPAAVMDANNPSVGIGTWTWSGPGTVSYQSGTTANDYNAEVLFSASGSYTGTWSISNGSCTASTDDVIIAVNNPDVITTTAGATGTCVSDGVNNWVHFYDANGNIIASVDDQGELMGDVTVEVPTVGNASASAVCSGGNNSYMGRYFSWSSTNTGWYGNNVTVRLYFTDAELASLISEAGCGDPNGCADDDDVCSIGDIVGTKYSTGTAPGSAGGIFLPQVGNGYDANFAANYVDFNVNGFSDIYLHGSEHNVPLPVELVSWEAKAIDNNYIELTWSTATEINNDYFEILRSTDGINFEKLAEVSGHGNSNEINNYAYSDYMVENNIVYYYQLKQVDFDGQFELFEVKSAFIKKQNSAFEIAGLVPNPTNENSMVRTTIKTNASEVIRVLVFNQIGMNIESFDFVVEPGSNDINIPINDYAAGTYFVNFESIQGVETKKLVITK